MSKMGAYFLDKQEREVEIQSQSAHDLYYADVAHVESNNNAWAEYSEEK